MRYTTRYVRPRKQRARIPYEAWQTFWYVVGFIGFGIVLNTAGASDLDLLTWSQLFQRSLVGVAMMVGGAWMGGLL